MKTSFLPNIDKPAPMAKMTRLEPIQRTVLDLGNVCRMALTVSPQYRGDMSEQVRETLTTLDGLLEQQPVAMTLTMQTFFVRSAEDISGIRQLLEEHYAERLPATGFIVQPPCDGKEFAIEAWAIGGEEVAVDFVNSEITTVEYNGLRWIYINAISVPHAVSGAYEQTQDAFFKLFQALEKADASFRDVTRIWFYQHDITENEITSAGETVERYRELNRSRTDLFEDMEHSGQMPVLPDGRTCYPPSTGIGMSDDQLIVGCTALQSERDDIQLIPLENPNQTAAFDYARHFSAKSPKFSRAMAMLADHYTTIWISGTASILDSESVHLGDIEKQTEQTIDNIEALMSSENFKRHGIDRAGAGLSDLARVRIYVKRQEDYALCRAVCERRFGAVPSIYVLADVCRSELLVEIEGVAFSNIKTESDEKMDSIPMYPVALLGNGSAVPDFGK